MGRVGIVCTVLTVTLIGNACSESASEPPPSTQPAATVSNSTSVQAAPSSSMPVVIATSGSTTSSSQPSSTTTVLAPVDSLASGLFCRDLAPAGYSYADVVTYWTREGRPQRMDADRNGIPCETVFDGTTVAAFWGEPLPTTTTTSTAVPFSGCTNQSSIPYIECEALVAFYHSTHGPAWNSERGWLTDPDPCAWLGVKCAGGSVTKLELVMNNLSGTTPPELGNLTKLNVLRLDENRMTGPIPPELGSFTNLTELRLGGNLLSGPVPPELANLTNLYVLSLYYNGLSGPIPSELVNLSSLFDLVLYGNHLSGPVPPELEDLRNLERLWLWGQSECLTAAEPSFAEWLASFDPDWNDGCPTP